ncbi:MAG: methylmalonyl Co-A mutase-associated GTPase MeaB [Rhodocyclaceae bacterium]|nr:methylmalonyl Co-A mutase-associated GTPase MeaB [Rhodocyclaceae bacterium]
MMRELPEGDARLMEGVLRAERRGIAKSITLLESTRADHRARAHALLESLLPHSGRSLRLGISGVPGVGKSTFIEALGMHLIGQGHKVAVLAIDPSSSVTGGSILGDKTRMEKLSMAPEAYIRPSPSAGSLGGVAARTRESMLVCEAAGFDIVIVETVGVGQSETAVAGMTDMFVLLQLPNAGDDLQAIKKGIVELADLVVFNKCDIDPRAAQLAMSQMRGALSMLRAHAPDWRTPVIGMSALAGEGLDGFLAEVQRYREQMQASGAWEARRRHQAADWTWSLIDQGLRARFHDHAEVRALLPELMQRVERGDTTPGAAADRLLAAFTGRAGP